MICLSTEAVLRGDEEVLRLDVHVPEHELYEKAPTTLEGVRDALRTGHLPGKRSPVPPPPFLVKTPGDLRTIVVFAAEGWEGEFPGKRFALFTRDSSEDSRWLVGKTLEVLPVEEVSSVDRMRG